MMKSVTSLLVIGLTFGQLMSCSKLDDTAKNAKQATVNSGVAADAASQSREEIANGRVMTRSGSSSASRREALEQIPKVKSLAQKITEASKYVKAFEFQLWTGQRYDTDEYKLRLYEDAMEEFFRAIYELADDKSVAHMVEKGKINPFKIIGSGKSKDIMAVAIAMHGVHNVQELVTVPREDKNADTTSIYGLIKEGLRKAEMVEAGKMQMSDLEEYEQTVYDYREEARALVEVRYNGMLTLAIARLSNIKESMLKGLANIYLGLPRSFESKFYEMNIGRQFQTNVYLDGAIKTQRFMREVNIPERMIKPLRKLYGKMIIKDYEPGQGDVLANSVDLKKEDTKYQDNLSNLFNISDGRIQLEE